MAFIRNSFLIICCNFDNNPLAYFKYCTYTFTSHFIRNTRLIPSRFWAMLTRMHHIIAANMSATYSCCESPILPYRRGGYRCGNDLLSGTKTARQEDIGVFGSKGRDLFTKKYF